MKFSTHAFLGLLVIVYLLAFSNASALAGQSGSRDTQAMTFSFGGDDYVHRWSMGGQNEFTPLGESNLETWCDMVTLNVHETVTNGDQLAGLANRVLDNYERHGKILRTGSKPRTEESPAEHLAVAVLGAPTFLEAAFARFLLVDGIGVVVVYSHRIYANPAGEAMSEWLATNGPQVEGTLMAWDKLPSIAALKELPQEK